MKITSPSLTLSLALALATTTAHANVTFNLIPEAGTPQFAIDGFTTAANLWSARLADNITVNVQIGFSPLGPGIIGEAGSAYVEPSYAAVTSALGTHRTSVDDFSAHAALQPGASFQRVINHTSNNPNGANSATPYVDTMDRIGLTTANAKALGLVGPSGSLDALIRFSSAFNFDFSHGASIGSGQIDFVGAAAHELGHALGFVSGVDDIDTSGGVFPGNTFSSNLLDLFRYSTLSTSLGAGVTDYTADNRDKYFSVDGGATSLALFSNGSVYGDGRQASHWKDNLGIGIMDPTAGFGEHLDISGTDLRAFDVLGYTLVPEPSSGLLFSAGLLLIVRRARTSRPQHS